ncbi:MAG TPA: hypothetical protein VFX15_02860 [Actinomycetes bacterium]|nr:hypothetical protein [Actinomycetes bacterium]
MATQRKTTRRQPTRKPRAAAKPTAAAETSADLEAGKVAAEVNADQQDSTLTTDDGRDIEELRKERADLIREIQELEEKKVKAAQDAAAKAGQVAKIDDAGALEQQEAARDSGRELYDRLGILEGPPVVAPQLDNLDGKVKVVSRREGDSWNKSVNKLRFVGFVAHVVGEDLPWPAEIIVDIRRKDGSDHQRFSAWSENGTIDVPLPGITGVGDYVLHLEHLETRVGEGSDERLPIVRESKPLEINLY